jgi:hypothetical protein
MQLRDENPSIVAPGCWGLFGGHLDPGETPEQSLRPGAGDGAPHPPPHDSCVLRRAVLALVSSDDLIAGSIWSTHLGCHRLLAGGLQEGMQDRLNQSV